MESLPLDKINVNFHQLIQLKKLDRVAYSKSISFLYHRQWEKAAQTIRDAMQNALTRLTSPPTFNYITQIIQDKQQWHSGETIDLWHSGPLSIHIRNESGMLKVLIITEGETLMDRETKTLQVGYLDPRQGRWESILSAKSDYDKILKERDVKTIRI